MKSPAWDSSLIDVLHANRPDAEREPKLALYSFLVAQWEIAVTTLRIYDPNIDAWRLLWSDRVTGFFTQQSGRAKGPDIVQEGPDPRGGYMRWTFTEIQRTSFHWTAECSKDSKTWRKEVDIQARRK